MRARKLDDPVAVRGARVRAACSASPLNESDAPPVLGVGVGRHRRRGGPGAAAAASGAAAAAARRGGGGRRAAREQRAESALRGELARSFLVVATPTPRIAPPPAAPPPARTSTPRTRSRRAGRLVEPLGRPLQSSKRTPPSRPASFSIVIAGFPPPPARCARARTRRTPARPRAGARRRRVLPARSHLVGDATLGRRELAPRPRASRARSASPAGARAQSRRRARAVAARSGPNSPSSVARAHGGGSARRARLELIVREQVDVPPDRRGRLHVPEGGEASAPQTRENRRSRARTRRARAQCAPRVAPTLAGARAGACGTRGTGRRSGRSIARSAATPPPSPPPPLAAPRARPRAPPPRGRCGSRRPPAARLRAVRQRERARGPRRGASPARIIASAMTRWPATPPSTAGAAAPATRRRRRAAATRGPRRPRRRRRRAPRRRATRALRASAMGGSEARRRARRARRATRAGAPSPLELARVGPRAPAPPPPPSTPSSAAARSIASASAYVTRAARARASAHDDASSTTRRRRRRAPIEARRAPAAPQRRAAVGARRAAAAAGRERAARRGRPGTSRTCRSGRARAPRARGARLERRAARHRPRRRLRAPTRATLTARRRAPRRRRAARARRRRRSRARPCRRPRTRKLRENEERNARAANAQPTRAGGAGARSTRTGRSGRRGSRVGVLAARRPRPRRRPPHHPPRRPSRWRRWTDAGGRGRVQPPALDAVSRSVASSSKAAGAVPRARHRERAARAAGAGRDGLAADFVRRRVAGGSVAGDALECATSASAGARPMRCAHAAANRSSARAATSNREATIIEEKLRNSEGRAGRGGQLPAVTSPEDLPKARNSAGLSWPHPGKSGREWARSGYPEVGRRPHLAGESHDRSVGVHRVVPPTCLKKIRNDRASVVSACLSRSWLTRPAPRRPRGDTESSELPCPSPLGRGRTVVAVPDPQSAAMDWPNSNSARRHDGAEKSAEKMFAWASRSRCPRPRRSWRT